MVDVCLGSLNFSTFKSGNVQASSFSLVIYKTVKFMENILDIKRVFYSPPQRLFRCVLRSGIYLGSCFTDVCRNTKVNQM